MANGNGSTGNSSDTGGGDLLSALPSSTASQGQGGGLRSPNGSSRSFSVRPDLLRSVIHEESGGRANAVSPKGAIGLMQIMPATAAQYGINNPASLYNPQLNQQLGQRYLTDLLHRYHGNEFLALVAYNSGPGRVDKGQLLPQSVRYASRILGRAPRFGSYQGGDIAASMSPDAASPPQGLLSALTPGQQPWYSRMAKSIEGGLGASEAEAAEGPPSGSVWETSDESTPPKPDSASAAPESAASPDSGQQADQGGGDKPFWMNRTPMLGTQSQPGTQQPAPTQQPPQSPFGGMQVSETIGPYHIKGPAPQVLTSQQKMKNAQIDQTIAMIDQNAQLYDQKFTSSKLSQFGQAPGQTTTGDLGSKLQGVLQPYRMEHPNIAQFLPGGVGDEDANDFMERNRNIMSQYIKNVVGVRVSDKTLESSLAMIHPTDPLPLQRHKLQVLKEQLMQMKMTAPGGGGTYGSSGGSAAATDSGDDSGE